MPVNVTLNLERHVFSILDPPGQVDRHEFGIAGRKMAGSYKVQNHTPKRECQPQSNLTRKLYTVEVIAEVCEKQHKLQVSLSYPIYNIVAASFMCHWFE